LPYRYNELKKIRHHACREYIDNVEAMEREIGFGPGEIPQAHAISDFLGKRTGFQLRPVAGLLSSRDFFAGLAYRIFFSTQYVFCSIGLRSFLFLFAMSVSLSLSRSIDLLLPACIL
jgi:hypothetical protein